ncbi:MAG: hypothetical protein AAB556_01480 [Patescibacteria group bacterium]
MNLGEKIGTFFMLALVGILMAWPIKGGYVPFGPPPVMAQQNQNVCKTYYDKAKELAEKGAEDLAGQVVDFDPRIAKSKASIAYSQIYRNCKEWGE